MKDLIVIQLTADLKVRTTTVVVQAFRLR